MPVNTTCRKSDGLKCLACFLYTQDTETMCYCHLRRVISTQLICCLISACLWQWLKQRFLSLLNTAKKTWNFSWETVRYLNYMFLVLALNPQFICQLCDQYQNLDTANIRYMWFLILSVKFLELIFVTYLDIFNQNMFNLVYAHKISRRLPILNAI